MKDKVVEICQKAEQADLAGSGSILDFERHLETLLELFQDNLEHNRELVIDCLSSIGRREINAPQETLEFCMHTLRLEEVLVNLEVFHLSIDKNSSRFINYRFYLNKIRASMRPEWDDRDMFTRYSRHDT